MDCETGIYLITHIDSGRTYVGLTGVSFKKRWKEHRLRLNSGTAKSYVKLQRAWDKYGESAFEFSVYKFISQCGLSHNEFYKLLRSEEVFVLALFENHLNSTIAGVSGMKQTEESKAKISKAHTGRKLSEEHKAKVRAAVKIQRETTDFTERSRLAATGRIMSPEHKAALHGANIGNQYTKGLKHTDEWKKKASERHKGNKYCLGKKMTDEQRKAQSIRIKEWWAKRKAKR